MNLIWTIFLLCSVVNLLLRKNELHIFGVALLSPATNVPQAEASNKNIISGNFPG